MINETPYRLYDPRTETDNRLDLNSFCGRKVASLAADCVVIFTENAELVENDGTLRRFFSRFESRSLVLFVNSRSKRTRRIEQFLGRESQSRWGFLTVFEDQEDKVQITFDCMKALAEYNGEFWILGLCSDSAQEGLAFLRQERFLEIEHFEEQLKLFDCLLFRNYDYAEWTLFYRVPSHYGEAIEFFESTASEQLRQGEA